MGNSCVYEYFSALKRPGSIETMLGFMIDLKRCFNGLMGNKVVCNAGGR